MAQRKASQAAGLFGTAGTEGIVVICDDGTIWKRHAMGYEWVLLPPIPQAVTVKAGSYPDEQDA